MARDQIILQFRNVTRAQSPHHCLGWVASSSNNIVLFNLWTGDIWYYWTELVNLYFANVCNLQMCWKKKTFLHSSQEPSDKFSYNWVWVEQINLNFPRDFLDIWKQFFLMIILDFYENDKSLQSFSKSFIRYWSRWWSIKSTLLPVSA